MAISFSCECGKTFSVKDELAGRAGKCQACGRTLKIPPVCKPLREDSVVPATAPSGSTSTNSTRDRFISIDVDRIKPYGREKWRFTFFDEYANLQCVNRASEIRFPDPEKKRAFRFGSMLLSGWNFQIADSGKELRFRVPEQGLGALKSYVTRKPTTELMQFTYTGIAKRGKAVEGTVNAENEVAAKRIVERLGYVPLSVVPAPGICSVGGWLLFLCVCLVIIGPLITGAFIIKGIFDLEMTLRNNPQVPQQVAGRVALEILSEAAGRFALVVYGIYAGVRLWGIRPHAVQTAQKYLFWAFGWAVVANSLLPKLFSLPVESAEVARAVTGPAAGYLIWSNYLRFSRRVKSTYPDAVEEKEA